MKRKIWVTIGFTLGALATILGAFIPGTFCMDACSQTPPNLHLIVAGIMLLIVTAILRRPPAEPIDKAAAKAARVAARASGDLLPAPNWSLSGKRVAGLGWTLGCGGFLLIALSLNGWVLFMFGMAAIPFIGIALLIWLIVAVSKRKKQ